MNGSLLETKGSVTTHGRLVRVSTRLRSREVTLTCHTSVGLSVNYSAGLMHMFLRYQELQDSLGPPKDPILCACFTGFEFLISFLLRFVWRGPQLFSEIL